MARRSRGMDGGTERLGGRVKRLVVPGLLVAALYYAVFGGEYSLFELRRARADAEAEQESLELVRAEIDSLQAWADSLRSDPSTIERIAREEFGMIRDGETLYRFVDSEAGGGEAPAPAPER